MNLKDYYTKNIIHGNIDLSQSIDITVDGADKVSKDFFLIKGGGGALLREKICRFKL